MLIARIRDELRHMLANLRASRGAVAVVPTMGAVHAGHLSLTAPAREKIGNIADAALPVRRTMAPLSLRSS
jgi:pantoate--beta-alanine ligase